MKEYTSEERCNLAKSIHEYIEQGNSFELELLCREDPYALNYLVWVTLKQADKIKHIKSILE